MVKDFWGKLLMP
jgi:hypothetical protein